MGGAQSLLSKMHLQKGSGYCRPETPRRRRHWPPVRRTSTRQVPSRPSRRRRPRSSRTATASSRSSPPSSPLRRPRSRRSFRRLRSETAHPPPRPPPPPRAPRWRPGWPGKGPCGCFLLGRGCYGITPSLKLASTAFARRRRITSGSALTCYGRRNGH